MKTNYKSGDDITVIKPSSPFNGLTGKVISNNTETKIFKPLSCDLSPCGVWQFNYEDVKPVKPEKEAVEKFPFDKPVKIIKKVPTKKPITKKKNERTKKPC